MTTHATVMGIDRKARGLRELAPRKEGVESSRAALALKTWFDLSGPARGVRCPEAPELHTTPGTGNNATLRVRVPLDDPASTLIVYAFIDNSAVLTRRTPKGEIALPVVFRLRQYYRANDPHIRVLNPKRSKVDACATFEDYAGQPEDRWTSEELAVAGNEVRDRTAFRALRQDMLQLRDLFDRLPWVVPPHGGPLPDGVLTAADTEALGLPDEAIGQTAYWPEALPRSFLTDASLEAVRETVQDLADYLGTIPTGRDRLILSMTSMLPSRWKMSPVQRAEELIRATWFGQGIPSSKAALHCLESEKIADFPIAAESVVGFDFASPNLVKPRVGSAWSVSVQAQPVSAHRRLQLTARFGPVKQELLETTFS